jgi:hypothetical protein
MAFDLNDVRRSISATLDDIARTTRALRAQGIDPSDPSDREARDIINRIERRLAAQQPADAYQEAE